MGTDFVVRMGATALWLWTIYRFKAHEPHDQLYPYSEEIKAPWPGNGFQKITNRPGQGTDQGLLTVLSLWRIEACLPMGFALLFS